MKKKILMYALLVPVMFFSINHRVTAQAATARGQEDSARVDSLVQADDERVRNSENLSDLKSEKDETKVKAKEAQRVENEANDAAQESKTAYRQEKKAQKAREQADKQAKKAEKARTKSDKN